MLFERSAFADNVSLLEENNYRKDTEVELLDASKEISILERC